MDTSLTNLIISQANKHLPRLARLLSLPVVAILLIFNIRRLIFTITILLTNKKTKKIPANQDNLPEVLVLIPCRNEVEMIPEICQAFSRLDYPVEKYQVVLIDDGSTDGTGEMIRQQAGTRPGWHVLTLPRNRGKANALNIALAQFPAGEIIYIFDADHRPEADVIKRAVPYFEDATVAAVAGFTRVLNPIASPIAYYSAVESYANQLITIRAKDHLGLAPALLGSNCGYRRQALMECGGFRDGAFSEDSDLTVAFHKAGYRIRFVEDAVSYQQVPQSIQGYLKQHIRWGRGMNDVAKVHGLEILRSRKLALPLRFELLVFTAGYLDRIALVGAAALTVLASVSQDRFRFSPKIILFALLMPFAQIIALFIKERMQGAMWLRLPFMPIFFILDIFAVARAMTDTLLNRPRLWMKTERVNVRS
jgi:cellulose synthase/poly-beta-1,6-N-acetylglucosamine synthase-like glycosyltransferase